MFIDYSKYPHLRTALNALEADNGTPPWFFDGSADRAIGFLDLDKVNSIAGTAFSTKIGGTVLPGAESYTAEDRIGFMLVSCEAGEVEEWLKVHPLYEPLYQFLGIAFGEQTPEDMGLVPLDQQKDPKPYLTRELKHRFEYAAIRHATAIGDARIKLNSYSGHPDNAAAYLVFLEEEANADITFIQACTNIGYDMGIQANHC